MAKRRGMSLRGPIHTVSALKATAKACGSHFFDRKTMQFFNSKVVGKLHPVEEGAYFVTSEKGPYDTRPKFSVRKFSEAGCRHSTVGKGFQEYSSSREAHAEASRLAKGGLAGARRKRRK